MSTRREFIRHSALATAGPAAGLPVTREIGWPPPGEWGPADEN